MLFIMVAAFLAIPAAATEITAPSAPEDALELLPQEPTGFASDLWTVILRAVHSLQPTFAEGIAVCAKVFAVSMLISFMRNLSGRCGKLVQLFGMLSVSLMLLGATRSMVSLASETVRQLSDYGKLLLPVITAAFASQGAVTASAALFAGTAVFDTILSSAIAKLLLPLVYGFLALAIGAAATDEAMLGQLRDVVKWAVGWFLKLGLYLFTGYMSVTGVISGTTDAATLKAAKITMAGAVPLVGSILSDASEAVLVSAGMVKNAVGIYGLLAVIAIWITPFLRIGSQYLLLKLTAAICRMFDCKAINETVDAFAAAMGLMLAMTGSICVMLLISIVCFMRGVM